MEAQSARSSTWVSESPRAQGQRTRWWEGRFPAHLTLPRKAPTGQRWTECPAHERFATWGHWDRDKSRSMANLGHDAGGRQRQTGGRPDVSPSPGTRNPSVGTLQRPQGNRQQRRARWGWVWRPVEFLELTPLTVPPLELASSRPADRRAACPYCVRSIKETALGEKQSSPLTHLHWADPNQHRHYRPARKTRRGANSNKKRSASPHHKLALTPSPQPPRCHPGS